MWTIAVGEFTGWLAVIFWLSSSIQASMWWYLDKSWEIDYKHWEEPADECTALYNSLSNTPNQRQYLKLAAWSQREICPIKDIKNQVMNSTQSCYVHGRSGRSSSICDCLQCVVVCMEMCGDIAQSQHTTIVRPKLHYCIHGYQASVCWLFSTLTPLWHHNMIAYRSLNYAIDSTKVNSIQAPSMLSSIASNQLGRYLAWNFLRSNWDKLTDEWVLHLYINAITYQHLYINAITYQHLYINAITYQHLYINVQ